MSTDKITMFRARDSSWQKPLVRVEVDRVSDSSVWFGKSRIARSSEDTLICHDFETAKRWLELELIRQVERHQEAIADLQSRALAIVRMTADEITADDSRY